MFDETQNRGASRPSTVLSLKNSGERKKKVRCINITTKVVRAKIYRGNNKTEKDFFSTMKTMAMKVIIQNLPSLLLLLLMLPLLLLL